jgi:hypothetical protein
MEEKKRIFKDDVLVQCIDLTDYVKVKIYKTKDKEHFIDIRHYFDGLPTKKGIRFNKKNWDKLISLDLKFE